jgi:hypothetical protein
LDGISRSFFTLNKPRRMDGGARRLKRRRLFPQMPLGGWPVINRLRTGYPQGRAAKGQTNWRTASRGPVMQKTGPVEGRSHDTGVSRRAIIVVVLAVDIHDRTDNLFGIDVVERSDGDGVKPFPLAVIVTPGVSANAACLAERVVKVGPRSTGGHPRVFRQLLGATRQPEGIPRDDDEPRPDLAAQRAITTSSSLAQVDVRLETNGLAVTAARVGLESHGILPVKI